MIKKSVFLRVLPLIGALGLLGKSALAYTFTLTPDATTSSAVSDLGETFFPLWLQAIAFIIALYGAAWIFIMIYKGVRWLWKHATRLGGR